MDLYLLRHGDAADQITGGYARDEERPLTAAGRTEARAAAEALATLGVRLDLILTSPLTRAAETARIIAGKLALRRNPHPCDALAPGGDLGSALWPYDASAFSAPTDNGEQPNRLLAALRDAGTAEHALLVGHMPDLGALAGWLIWGRAELTLPLRTGGLCRITVRGEPAPGSGDLRWLLPPKLLRRLS